MTLPLPGPVDDPKVQAALDELSKQFPVKGTPGAAATVAVGTTTTGAAGSSASVSNGGTTAAAVLNFTIPRGDTGAAGTNGNTILNGSGAPTGGNNGDFWVDTTNNRLYGPKATGVWPTGYISLIGPTGTAATIAAGTTTTGAAGTSASVTNSGTSSAATFNFTIPRGDTGAAGSAATVAVGTTTTGAAGTSASVSNSGTSSAATLNFTIPKGDKGDAGNTGPGATVAVGTTTTGAAGTSASVSNSGTSSAATFNFTIPRGDTGAAGSAATVAVGTTTTGAAGSSASVSNSGTSSAATFNFTIPRGDTGTAGTDGRTVLNGAGAPAAGTGANGDFYIDTTNNTIYGPKASGAWPAGVVFSATTPTGSFFPYSGSAAPTGYLLCDGTAYSTTTYAALYAVIGTTYGSGTGTFKVPDLRGRLPMGAGTGAGDQSSGTGAPSGTALTARTRGGWGGNETHSLTTSEMPPHSHLAEANQRSNAPQTGSANVLGAMALGGNSSANTSTTGGSGSPATVVAHNNIQPYIVTNYIIKT